MIEGIVVLGDLLRPDGQGRPGGADRPTLWLWNALRRQLHLACGLPVAVLTPGENPALAAWIETLRPPAAADPYWAATHAALSWSEELERLVLARLRGRFCIGYEMPPWLVGLLTAEEIPFLDLRLHPVRFMDDLMFAARASLADTQAAMDAWAVCESAVLAIAGLREAMCRFISSTQVPDGTLLVIGQRPFDSTQIIDGVFFDAAARAEAIHALCARYPAMLLKPHPLDRASGLLAVAAAAPTRVLGVINDNVYRLLAQPQIGAVLTVNSGVAYEAPYFGKTVHALGPLGLRLVWRGAGVDPGAHVALDDGVLSPDFWRMVLAPHAQVSPPDGMLLAAKPNRLRIALDSFWNFQEIDTDRIPRPPAG